jgi:UDP-N-acetylmuramoyl-tripeptide--D-alanyl-D-alanine ligase
MLWSVADLALATGVAARVPFAAGGVSVDCRSLQPGDLFVALEAERDGHAFVVDALVARPEAV